MTELLRAGPETRITLHFAVRLMDGTDLDLSLIHISEPTRPY